MAVHAHPDYFPEIESALRQVRTQHRLPPEFSFKYHSARTSIRETFLQSVASMPITGTVLLIDKRGWGSDHFRGLTGSERIANCICDLLLEGEEAIISDQLVSIDYPKSESKTVQRVMKAIRAHFESEKRTPPKSMRAVTDTQSDGFLIQIADMVAGYMHDQCERASDLLDASIAKHFKVIRR